MKVVAWFKERWSWSHSAWGLVLALWLAISDIRLTPVSDDGGVAYVGPEAFLMMSVPFGILLGIMVASLANLGPRASTVSVVLGPVIGVAAVVVAGLVVDTVYNSYDVPTSRYLVLPILGIVLVAMGVAAVLLKRPHAEMILLSGVAIVTLAPYAQEQPLWIFAAVAIAMAVLLLWPATTVFGRVTGLALFMLALLSFLQLRIEWFGWISFPFLLFAPLYLVAMYWREPGTSRRVAWWTGTVFGVGATLLGLTTGVAAVVKSLPLVDSLVMLAIGASFTTVFFLLAMRDGEGAMGFPMPKLS